MSVRLTVTQRSQAGSAAKPVEHVLDDPSITLGRDKGCQVVLAQQSVSRNHARISQEGNLFFLEDLGSAYGTQVNGKPLPKGEKHRLRNGDIIAIAQFDVTFTYVANLPTGGRSDKTSFVARSLVKDVVRGIKSGEGPYLRVMNGPREGERIEINDAHEFIIGRDESADIIFKDDLVSRRHVKIRRDWAGTHAEDLGSRNGIKINKKKVNRKTLREGDELEVGNIRLLYVDPTDLSEPSVPIPEPSPVDEEVENTDNNITIRPRRGSRVVSKEPPTKAAEPAREEPPREEPPKEEPPPPEPEPVAAEPEPAPEPPPPEPALPDEPVEDEPAKAGLMDKQKMVPLAIMGLFAIFALGLIIAVLAGA